MKRSALLPTGMLIGHPAPIGTSMAMGCLWRSDASARRSCPIFAEWRNALVLIAPYAPLTTPPPLTPPRRGEGNAAEIVALTHRRQNSAEPTAPVGNNNPPSIMIK